MHFTWTEFDDTGNQTVHTSTDECDAFLDGKKLFHKRGGYVCWTDHNTHLPTPLSEKTVELIKSTPGEKVVIPYDPREQFYWIHKHGASLKSVTSRADPVPDTPSPDHSSFVTHLPDFPKPDPPSSLAAVLDADVLYQPPTKEWMHTTRKRLYEQLRVLIPLRKRFERTRSLLISAFMGGIPKRVTQASTSQYLLTFHRNGQRAMRCIDTITAGVDALYETADRMDRFNLAQGERFFPEDPYAYDSEDDDARMSVIDDIREQYTPPHTRRTREEPTDNSNRDLVEPLEHGLKALLRPDPGSIYYNFVQ